MIVSVIIPSRLARNPASAYGNLYLQRAIRAIRYNMQVPGVEDVEIIAALDPGAVLPDSMADEADLIVVNGHAASQAAVVNAAVKRARGYMIAFCEDDDIWDIGKLAAQVPLLANADMVTCNQREVDTDGAFIRVNDFPTPSGWLMRRETWDDLGGFDESYQFHMDTEFLARATNAGLRRVHVVEAGAQLPGRPWLQNVSRVGRSLIGSAGNREPLVTRTVNPEGGMARIQSDPAAAAISRDEHERMKARHGFYGW